MSQAGILNISASGPLPPEVATQYVADVGIAVPSSNILNVVTPNSGADGIETTGSGNTLTITLHAIMTSSGVAVDMKQVGATALFTTTADFFIVNLYAVGTNVSGAISSADFSLGWTAPNYDDLDINTSFPNTITANGVVSVNNDFSTPKIIPSGQTLFINIDTPSVATSDIETIYVAGFYL